MLLHASATRIMGAHAGHAFDWTSCMGMAVGGMDERAVRRHLVPLGLSVGHNDVNA